MEAEFTCALKRGHHGGDQAGHHDAAHAPGRRKLAQGERERQVGLLQRGVLMHHVDPVVHDQPQETRDQRPQEIDELGEHQAHQGVPRAAGRQHALDHRLVAHLIEREGPERGDDHSQEGRHLVIGRLVEVHAFGVGGDQGAPAAGDVAQGGKEQRDAADHQQNALEQVGPHHGGQSAVDRVGPHAHHDQQQHEIEVPAGHLGKRQAAGIEHGHRVDAHVEGQQHARVDRAAGRPETVGQETGHGRHLVLQIDRDEDRQNQRVAGQPEPFPVGDAHAVLIGGADGADHLLAGDAGGHEGRADQPPGHVVAAEEIAVGRVATSSGRQKRPRRSPAPSRQE